jgi:hypothetical protein
VGRPVPKRRSFSGQKRGQRWSVTGPSLLGEIFTLLTRSLTRCLLAASRKCRAMKSQCSRGSQTTRGKTARTIVSESRDASEQIPRRSCLARCLQTRLLFTSAATMATQERTGGRKQACHILALKEAEAAASIRQRKACHDMTTTGL